MLYFWDTLFHIALLFHMAYTKDQLNMVWSLMYVSHVLEGLLQSSVGTESKAFIALLFIRLRKLIVF